jgi:hypothetical protein
MPVMKKKLIPIAAILLSIATPMLAQQADPKPPEAPKEIPKSVFPKADGENATGIYLDLAGTKGERLYARYCPIADSGVEVERVAADGTVLWRTYVEGIGVSHSRYRQQVSMTLSGESQIWLIIDGSGRLDVYLDLKTGTSELRKKTEAKPLPVAKPKAR